MANSTSIIDRFNSWARNSITLKLLTIGFLILVLLIPSGMVSSLVNEREGLRDGAISEVSSKWGGAQTLTGPVITVPYYVTYKNDKNEIERSTQYAHFLPDSIYITGELKPEKRSRGIYLVILYNARLKISGSFPKLDFDALQIAKEDFLLDQAFISFGVSDMKGIRDNITLHTGDTSYNFNPGIPTADIFESGISFPINLQKKQPRNFDLALNLNGSTDINFLPFGKETNVELKSSWGDPSFNGAFLPETRTVDASGFSAKWRVLQLNRNYPQQGTGKFISRQESGEFGVKLLLPVDEYQKTLRSAKYCSMFIILTFLTFFFVEVLNKRRIHTIQYLLVGSAITLFYVLLLSMSEHLSFNLSYLIASVIILLLVTLYGKSILKSGKLTALLGGILAVLYLFFYSLLQLEDYSLLMGSFGLLLILAIIMYLTRKVDWYSFKTDDTGEENG